MSIEKINDKMNKLQAELEKQEIALQKRMTSLLQQTGLLDVKVPEKVLKAELKALADKLKNPPKPPPSNNSENS